MHNIGKLSLAGAAALAALVVALRVLAAASFNPDAQPVGYVGQPVMSSLDVSRGDAKMYAIDYLASDWSGNLHAYPVTSAGAVGGADDWGSDGASGRIKAQHWDSARKIVTIRNGAGIRFRWDQLSGGAGGQQQALDPAAYAAAAASSPLLDYLRGRHDAEGTGAGQLRPRAGGLGDIIHSTPVYWDDGVHKTVFVGANDGMLHAIDALDGSERFAYVPALLLPRLAALGSQAYAHQYYVDGRLDVKKFGAKTILVGALGAGGKGLYALDVSNAAASSEDDAAAKVLWEVSDASAGFADLGYTYGAPTLARLPGGASAVVVGNGYNNQGSGHAVLYLIDAASGALIKALDTGAGSPASPDGLSSPSLWDTDGDGVQDTAYAGDIDGNLWKFSLVAPYTAPVELFVNSAGASQAITMAPGLSAHPLGGVMVDFVSGRMLTGADASDTAAHYAYGVWDGAPAANDAFLEQTLTEANYINNDSAIRVRTATARAPDWRPGAGHHRGWRTLLPIGGERVVGDGAFVTGEIFQFFSTNPTVSPGALPPGENWWMQLNALTGGDSGTTLFDLNGDKQFSADDRVGGLDPVGRAMGGGVRSQLIALSAFGVDVFQSNFDRNSAPQAGTVSTSTRTVEGQRGVSGGHFDTDIFCYTNCGASSSTYRTISSPDGVYSIGSESGGDTDRLKYVHVHEYDDIYDRVGINMLHPSQDLQRLPLAKASSSVTEVPDTPALKSGRGYPASGVTVMSSVTGPGKLARSVPADTYAYASDAPVAVAGYPVTTVGASDTRVTAKTHYGTTLTLGQAVNVGARDNNRRYPFNWRTTVRHWDTETTSVALYPNVRFKVLMANQAYSPAVHLTIDGAATPTLPNASFNDAAFHFESGAGLAAASLPSYQMADISKLVLSMPLDAFNLKNWGTGIVRAGLHPIKPQCAGVATAAPTPGPLGEWRNGALTLQIVDASVTDSDIRLNVAGHPELGYRLKGTSLAGKLIAEYLIYWHHPMDKCMGDTGWTMAPPQDSSASDAIQGSYPPGEDDPRGVFMAGAGAAGDTVIPSAPAPLVVTNPDGSVTTTTISYTALSSGGYIETTTVSTVPAAVAGGASSGIVTGGGVSAAGQIDTGGIDKNAASLGRINWRELQR